MDTFSFKTFLKLLSAMDLLTAWSRVCPFFSILGGKLLLKNDAKQWKTYRTGKNYESNRYLLLCLSVSLSLCLSVSLSLVSPNKTLSPLSNNSNPNQQPKKTDYCNSGDALTWNLKDASKNPSGSLDCNNKDLKRRTICIGN